jgi:hypothetical protein
VSAHRPLLGPHDDALALYTLWREAVGHMSGVERGQGILPERIARKIGEPDENGCWPWLAYRTPLGYGGVDWKGKPDKAHRVVYQILAAPIPGGLVLDHLCRNPSCVNPEHLEPVTDRENILRGAGACAQHARKTHCVRGHPFEGENLHVRRDGARICLTCRREYRSTLSPEKRAEEREREILRKRLARAS